MNYHCPKTEKQYNVYYNTSNNAFKSLNDKTRLTFATFVYLKAGACERKQKSKFAN